MELDQLRILVAALFSCADIIAGTNSEAVTGHMYDWGAREDDLKNADNLIKLVQETPYKTE